LGVVRRIDATQLQAAAAPFAENLDLPFQVVSLLRAVMSQILFECRGQPLDAIGADTFDDVEEIPFSQDCRGVEISPEKGSDLDAGEADSIDPPQEGPHPSEQVVED